MSSTRAKNIREKNQVVKLVKDLNKKMESFEETVQELKILKETIEELDDQVREQEAKNSREMSRLNQELKDNKFKVVNDVVQTLGKVIISNDELNELKNDSAYWKNQYNNLKQSSEEDVKQRVNEQLDKQLKILELQNQNKLSRLEADRDAFNKEIENYKSTITRMSEELDSQKRLTADIAQVGRRNKDEEKK